MTTKLMVAVKPVAMTKAVAMPVISVPTMASIELFAVALMTRAETYHGS